MDVKFLFLNGYLEEEVYIEQSLGFEIEEQQDKVYELKWALYNLKQASRAWNSRIDANFTQNRFIKHLYEHALYSKSSLLGDIMFECLYVDDLIFTRNGQFMID